MTYELYYTDHHFHGLKERLKEPGVTLVQMEEDGWGEVEYRKAFEADNLEQARAKAFELCDSSSGVFNVYQNGELIFTEEEL